MPSPKEFKRQAKRRKQVRHQRLARARNVSARSGIRTSLRRAREAIESGEGADEAVRTVQSKLDAAARKGIIQKNNAARRLQRLVARLRAASA